MTSTASGFRRLNRNMAIPNKSNKDVLHTQQTATYHQNFSSEHGIEMALKRVTSVNNIGKLELSCQKDPYQKENKITSLMDCGKKLRKSVQVFNYGLNFQANSNNNIATNFQIEQARNVYERLHNNKNIIVEKERVSMSDRFFKSLLEQYHIKIQNIGDQNRKLVDLKDRFQCYLASLNLTQVWKSFYGQETENAESPLRNQKQMSAINNLKILNLEKKNQTLNFIIKQYRKGNQQQIKNLQKKINQFRPNIERELTQKLEEVNRKLKDSQCELNYFKSEFRTNCPSFTWDQTILKNRQYIEKYEQIRQENQKFKNQIQRVTKDSNEIKANQLNQQLLLKEINDLRQKIQDLKSRVNFLQTQVEQQQQRIDSLERIQQDFKFNREKYKGMQEDMYRKSETLKQSSVIIAKLQSENLIISQKLISLVDNEHKKIFMQEKLRKNLQQMFTQINQLKRRTEQSIFDSRLDVKEKRYFLSHLIEKICHNYDGIVGQYQQQLILYEKQSQQWETSIKKISFQQQTRNKLFQEGRQQLTKIKAKHSRCLDSMRDIENNTQCRSCRGWMAHWGQIDNIYLSAAGLLQKLIAE